MTWTPPEDAEVSNSNWTPPEDAVPVDSKKKESSVGSLTGSESTTPSQSTSTSEIPTVQITDGEIDAAPLNRPSTMPYGVKMGEDGVVGLDIRVLNQVTKDTTNRSDVGKMAVLLRDAASKTFSDNPELFADYQNRDAYFNRLLKNYKGDDYWKVKSEIYKADPRFTEQKKQEVISGAITNIVDPTGGFVSGAIKGAKEGVSHGADQISRSSKLLSSAKTPYDIAAGITGEVYGAASIAMGAANLFVPELAAFTIGSKEAEEKAPGISNILAPINYVITEYYKDKGEDVPELASNLGALGDLALPILFGVGGKKIAKKFEGKPISKEILEEAIKETPKEDIDSAIENVIKKDNTDNSDGVHNANSVLMEEANSLSYQAEILKADLEKAKGTIAEPVIAQKIEELNAKINEVHGKEVERQTAEAHTLSTLDHLQKQREELVAQKATLSSEGQKALEPEIQKVDDMIKEVEPKKEESDIEDRRSAELSDRVVYDRMPTVDDGEFRIIGDPNKEVYRINENTGRLQRFDKDTGLWTVEGTHGKLELYNAKKNGFEKTKDGINKKYDNFKNKDSAEPKKEEAKEVVPDNEVKETDVEGLTNKVAERKPTDGHYGSGENVKFTDNVAVPFRYKLVEADQLQPSHLASGERNPNHQISLAQPKERNDVASKRAQDKIAANPNLAEVGEGPNAFFGAPIVNKAGEVIQGNNRSIGLKKHYKQKGSSYKSQLSENAEKFGLTKDQVEGMENPILVREVAVDDNTSVQLGNFDVKDLETGGKQRIDPIVTARKMTPENKSSLSSIVFDGDYKTVKEAIRANVGKVAEIVKKYLNPAQFAKAFNKAGEITESGMDDIASVVNHFLFDKGDPVLPEAFSQIPDVIQKGLQKSLKYIMGTPEGKSILPETQNAVLAIYEWKQSGVADFNEWAAQTDMFKGVTPKDVLSPLEFELAKKLSEAKTQADVSKVFAEYNDLVSDKPADMFNEATPGLSHNDAVKKQFKLSDYERTENKSEGHTETQGTKVPVDVTPKEVSGEKAAPAKAPKVAEVVQPVEVRVEPVVKGERVEGANKDKGSAINEQISWTGDIVEIKRSIKESDSNKFREIQETTSESVKQKRMDNLSPEELRIEKNYGEIIKQLKERGLLEGPCI